MQHADNSSGKISKEQGRILVRLARQTIMDQLGCKSCRDDFDVLAAAREVLDFQAKRGTFICLKIEGRLRGCIGSLAATESIVDGVMDNAVNAAFHDPRFSPLSDDELDKVSIEVSVLTDPQPLDYDGPADLIAKLRPGVDGLIIRKGPLSATFLPQVWEQLPKPEDFLSHLCRKAGLPGDSWKTTTLEVSTYQVQYFSENA